MLKKDAEEMEKRLQALQERMKQQQLQDEAKTMSGGGSSSINNKWKSASKEKGSVTNYGKDVQERYRKRVGAQTVGDPVLRPTGTLLSRTAAIQIQQKTDFRSKGRCYSIQLQHTVAFPPFLPLFMMLMLLSSLLY